MYIYIEILIYIYINNKKNKRPKGLNRYLIIEDTQMVNKHMKRSPHHMSKGNFKLKNNEKPLHTY